MNDNFDTKIAIREALVSGTGLDALTAKTVVEFMTTEGIIDFPVATELYDA